MDADLVLCLLTSHGVVMPRRLMHRLSTRLCTVLLDPKHLRRQTDAHCVQATRILGQKFSVWRPFVLPVFAKVFARLINMTMQDRSAPLVASNAERTLARVGQSDTPLFLQMVRSELKAERSLKHHEAVLRSLSTLVQRHPRLTFDCALQCVEAAIVALDPSRPHRRKTCLAATTRTLKIISATLHNVAIHYASNRIAVGSGNDIILYDLRTASQALVLRGHSGRVVALAFRYPKLEDATGVLASYCATAQSLRMWHTASTGLFSILGLQRSKCVRTAYLRSLPANKPVSDIVCTVVWLSPKTVLLTREDESTSQIKLCE